MISIDVPWCADILAGRKLFDSVANRKRLVHGFKRLRAGDPFVIVRKDNQKRVVAVAQVQSEHIQRQSDRRLSLQHLQPDRHGAISNFFGDALFFNTVFFRKVYLENLSIPALVARLPGPQSPLL